MVVAPVHVLVVVVRSATGADRTGCVISALWRTPFGMRGYDREASIPRMRYAITSAR